MPACVFRSGRVVLAGEPTRSSVRACIAGLALRVSRSTVDRHVGSNGILCPIEVGASAAGKSPRGSIPWSRLSVAPTLTEG
jgi:hypothetical protein